MDLPESELSTSEEPKRSEGSQINSTNDINLNDKVTKKKSVDDFIFGEVLGEGAYGAVLAAEERATGKKFAIKQLLKQHILKEKKAKYALTERDILSKCDHPNIIKLYYTFRDAQHLYYVMELASNGELLKYIRQYGSLALPVCAFYTAELVSALEYLHCVQGVIHRDLKPENILLSADWHVKLTDFGTAKIVGTDLTARSNSFLGTAEYISPELLSERVCYKASDLWALGCVVYQMIAGRPPFRGVTEYQTFQKVQKGEIVWPQNFPEVAKDLISRLLVMNPMERLGARDYKDLKAHPFFNGIQWQNLTTTMPPPITPYPQKLIWQDEVLKEEEERKRREREDERKKWEKFLLPKEQIVLGGLIYKRRKGTVKLRQLILTDKPRLIYIDPKKMEFKGEIPWSPVLRVEIKSDVNWRIHTPKRIYVLEDCEKNSRRWETAINRALGKSGVITGALNDLTPKVKNLQNTNK